MILSDLAKYSITRRSRGLSATAELLVVKLYLLIIEYDDGNKCNCYKSTLRKVGDDAVLSCREFGAQDVTSAGVDPVDETFVGEDIDADWNLSVGRHRDTTYDWQIVGRRQLVDLLVIRVREQQKRLPHQV